MPLINANFGLGLGAGAAAGPSLWTPGAITTQAWMDADEFDGGSHGDPVGTWSDKGGSNDATSSGSNRPTVDLTTGLGGSAVIDAVSPQHLVLTDSMSSMTSGAIMLLLKADSTGSTNQGSPVEGDPVGGKLLSHYDYAGTIYEAFGRTSRLTCGVPVTGITSWHLLYIESASGAWEMILNDQSQHSTASNTVDFVGPLELFRSRQSSTFAWRGQIALFWYTDYVPDATELEKWQGYAAHQRGLASSLLDPGHTWYSTPPTI